jgi:putative flavoprotein involved in K+ transport
LIADPPVVVIGAGQSGLAAAHALRELDTPAVVLEAGDRAAGSWPYYYDSLQAFSPAGFSSMPGMPFPGDPDRYPTRDEVAEYLDDYAVASGVEIRTNTPVVSVHRQGGGFVVVTGNGQQLPAAGIVAASGSFSNPHRPPLPGEENFAAELSHVADYRNPTRYAGRRVIVVGAGDSAAQVANELATVADVTLAVRHPLQFIPQRIGGRDVQLLAARDRLRLATGRMAELDHGRQRDHRQCRLPADGGLTPQAPIGAPLPR